MTTSNDWDYDTAIELHRAARDAFATITRIDSLDDPSCDISIMIRSLLIDRDDDDFSDMPNALPYISDIRNALSAIDASANYPHDESTTQTLSELLLSFSLCPMHAIDYAICFDDDDDECAILRRYFPQHDT